MDSIPLAIIYDKMHVTRVQWCNCPSGGLSLQTSCFRDILNCHPLPAGPISACSYSTYSHANSTWYNMLLLELSSVGLQNQSCAHSIPMYIRTN